MCFFSSHILRTDNVLIGQGSEVAGKSLSRIFKRKPLQAVTSKADLQ